MMGFKALFLALTMLASGCIGDFATEAELRAMLASNQKDATNGAEIGGGEVANNDTARRIGETVEQAPEVAEEVGVEPAPEVAEDAAIAEPTPEVVETTEVVEPEVPDVEEVEVADEVTVATPDADVAEDASEIAEPDIAETVPEVVETTEVVETSEVVDVDASEVPDTGEETIDVPIEVTEVAPDADVAEPIQVEEATEVVETTEVVDTSDAPDIPLDVPPELPLDPCLTKNCTDGNACTEDLCAVKSGMAKCINLPLSATACSDGNACTLGDQCSAGACKAGSAKTCEDNNPCTSDSCSTTTGVCSFVPVKPYLSDGFEYAAIEEASKSGWVFAGVTDPTKQQWLIAKAKEKLAKDGGTAGLGVQNAALGTTITASHPLPKLPLSGAVVKVYMTFYHSSSKAGYKLGWRALDVNNMEVAGDALAAPPSGTDKWATVPIPATSATLQLYLTAGSEVGATDTSVFDALQVADPACLK